jgi:hypothetical protein
LNSFLARKPRGDFICEFIQPPPARGESQFVRSLAKHFDD